MKKSAAHGRPPDTIKLLQEVRAVYDDLQAKPIERNCTLRTECCQFKLTGKTPYLTKGEALLAAQALRTAGRRELPESINGNCPLLHPRNGKCLIYAHRPFGCRTHFCRAAGGDYARSEVVDLIHRLEAVDIALEGDGARPIEAAITEALRRL